MYHNGVSRYVLNVRRHTLVTCRYTASQRIMHDVDSVKPRLTQLFSEFSYRIPCKTFCVRIKCKCIAFWLESVPYYPLLYMKLKSLCYRFLSKMVCRIKVGTYYQMYTSITSAYFIWDIFRYDVPLKECNKVKFLKLCSSALQHCIWTCSNRFACVANEHEDQWGMKNLK
jgi:hypothetical protein